MGHPGADDVPGHQGVQILLLAALLGLTAAQHRTQAAVRQLLKTGDHKAHRFAHPGEQRNIPGGAVLHAQCALVMGDHPLDASEVHQQIRACPADPGAPALEDHPLCHGLPQSLKRSAIPLIGSTGNLPSFRFITVHLSHSSCVIVPQQTPPLFYLAVFMYIPAGSGACSKALKKLFGFFEKSC